MDGFVVGWMDRWIDCKSWNSAQKTAHFGQRTQKFCLCCADRWMDGCYRSDKFFHTNLPQAGFELASLGPQAGMQPTEAHLLVQK